MGMQALFMYYVVWLATNRGQLLGTAIVGCMCADKAVLRTASICVRYKKVKYLSS